jgi:spore germination protein PA
MPAKVGMIKVVTISSSSIFNVGDVFHMAPKTWAKTFAGGGSFNTGNSVHVQVANSNTNIQDNEVVDQVIAGNA